MLREKSMPHYGADDAPRRLVIIYTRITFIARSVASLLERSVSFINDLA